MDSSSISPYLAIWLWRLETWVDGLDMEGRMANENAPSHLYGSSLSPAHTKLTSPDPRFARAVCKCDSGLLCENACERGRSYISSLRPRMLSVKQALTLSSCPRPLLSNRAPVCGQNLCQTKKPQIHPQFHAPPTPDMTMTSGDFDALL